MTVLLLGSVQPRFRLMAERVHVPLLDLGQIVYPGQPWLVQFRRQVLAGKFGNQLMSSRFKLPLEPDAWVARSDADFVLHHFLPTLFKKIALI